MDRTPAVAGSFYPADPAKLTAELERCVEPGQTPAPALGCIVPHAGYVYSGRVAGAVFSRLRRPQTVILLGPNHTGRGASLAVFARGTWQTPLGSVEVDEPLAASLLHADCGLEEDAEAHRFEHSLEVQLPFLRHLWPSARIVPIVVGTGELGRLQTLGDTLAGLLEDRDPRPLLLASSDMNHYESDGVSREKDRLALDRIVALDAEGLYDTVRAHRISMCGFAPAVAMLTAARKLGAESAEIVRYTNSGEVTGDTGAVVGYAGIIVR